MSSAHHVGTHPSHVEGPQSPFNLGSHAARWLPTPRRFKFSNPKLRRSALRQSSFPHESECLLGRGGAMPTSIFLPFHTRLSLTAHYYGSLLHGHCPTIAAGRSSRLHSPSETSSTSDPRDISRRDTSRTSRANRTGRVLSSSARNPQHTCN